MLVHKEVKSIRRAVFRFYEYIKTLGTDRDKRLVLISALLFSAGFAPLPFGFLAYISLVPLLIVAKGKGFKRGFQLGYLFGFEMSWFALHWIANVTFLGTVGVALIHSLYYAVIFGTFCWLYRRHKFFVITLPFIWITVEYLRTMSQFAFPWTNLSYTQSYYLPLIQTADIWGDIGISFWITVINLFIFLAWIWKGKKWYAFVPLAAVALIFAAAFLYDSGPKEYKTDIKVALLQGHFPLKVKWDRAKRDYNFEVYDSLTREAYRHGVDLIVWPETAAPMYLYREPRYYSWVRKLAIELRTHILVGTLVYENHRTGRGRSYNGCYQFTPQGQIQPPYKKIELVPFSERVPYADYFPAIKKIQLGQSDFSSGDSLMLFEYPKGNYGCLICFELAFSDLARRFVIEDADFLLTITNDTWFGKTMGPYQHMQMALFRAIENRIWIARCANSGFSFTVDPYGRKHGRSNLEVRTIVYGEIGKIEGETFFTRHGFWLPKFCMAITFLFLLAGLVVKIVRK